MSERQVTGTKMGSKVTSVGYHVSLTHTDEETHAILETEDGRRVSVLIPQQELAKIQRGDNVYVTVEITRDPE